MNINSKEIKYILDNLEYNDLFKESDVLQRKLSEAIMNRYSSRQIKNILIDFAIENNSIDRNVKLAQRKNILDLFKNLFKRTKPTDISIPKTQTLPGGRFDPIYDDLLRLKAQNKLTPQQTQLLESYEKQFAQQPTAVQKLLQPTIDLKKPSGQPPTTPTTTQMSPVDEFNDAIKQNNLQDVHSKVEEQIKKGIPRNRAIMKLGLPLGAIALYNLLVKQHYPQKPETETIPTPEQKPITTPQETTQSTFNLSEVDLKSMPDIDPLPKVQIFDPGDVSRFERDIPIGY